MPENNQSGGKLLKGIPGVTQFIDLIARMPEFQLLRREDLSYLAGEQARVYKRGEVIIPCSANDSNNYLAILLAGVCNVEKPIHAGGGRVWICINKVHAPTVFGEVGVFSAKPRIAAVVAEQRSVAIVARNTTVQETFRRSQISHKKMLWSFARLGVARCRAMARNYASLISDLFDSEMIDTRSVRLMVDQLETVVDNGPGSADTDDEIFNKASATLEWLDNVLALASYLNIMPDFPMPSANLKQIPGGRSICALAAEALDAGMEGKPVKSVFARVWAGRGEYPIPMESQSAFFQEMIQGLDDLLAVFPYSCETDAGFSSHPARVGRMVSGCASNICADLDTISAKTVEKFNLQNLPASIEEAGGNGVSLLNYLHEQIATVTGGVDCDDDILASVNAYGITQEELKNELALSVYSQLKRHPVIKLVISGRYPPPGNYDKAPGLFPGIPFMLNFFRGGFRIDSPSARDSIRV